MTTKEESNPEEQELILTQKQDNFCKKYIELGNASEAYRQSYNASNMKPESIHRKAKEVFDNGKVAARIKQLKQEAAERNRLTVDDLVKELEEARILASTTENPQTSSMVSATMGKAKLLGLVVDKSEVKATLADMTDDELARKRLELERQLEQSTKD